MVDYTRLRDLLPANENVSIEYRCNAPKCDDEDEMLLSAVKLLKQSSMIGSNLGEGKFVW